MPIVSSTLCTLGRSVALTFPRNVRVRSETSSAASRTGSCGLHVQVEHCGLRRVWDDLEPVQGDQRRRELTRALHEVAHAREHLVQTALGGDQEGVGAVEAPTVSHAPNARLELLDQRAFAVEVDLDGGRPPLREREELGPRVASPRRRNPDCALALRPDARRVWLPLTSAGYGSASVSTDECAQRDGAMLWFRWKTLSGS